MVESIYQYRAAAIAAGATKYTTGKPCKAGHNSPRYTLNGLCCQCLKNSASNVRNKKNGGLVAVTVHVLAADVEGLKAHAAALCIQRGILPPTQPGQAVAVPQPVDIAAARARIFGAVPTPPPLPDWVAK